jgi:hypothetical protein
MLLKCFLSGKGQGGQYDVTEDSQCKRVVVFSCENKIEDFTLSLGSIKTQSI